MVNNEKFYGKIYFYANKWWVVVINGVDGD